MRDLCHPLNSCGAQLFVLFDVRHDFPNEWFKSTQPVAGTTDRMVVLDSLLDRLPFYTKGKKIAATNAYLFTATATLPASIALLVGTDEIPIADPQPVGSVTQFTTGT
jgi:hypothetical protein